MGWFVTQQRLMKHHPNSLTQPKWTTSYCPKKSILLQSAFHIHISFYLKFCDLMFMCVISSISPEWIFNPVNTYTISFLINSVPFLPHLPTLPHSSTSPAYNDFCFSTNAPSMYFIFCYLYHPFYLRIYYSGDFSFINLIVKLTKVGSMVLSQLLDVDELTFCPYCLPCFLNF